MLLEPTCYTRECKHYKGVKRLGEEESTEVNYCKAFPDGIPDEIAYGDNKHTEPYPGDNGIQYEEE